jgi:enterochelin esterase-like enzyme
MTVRPLGWPAFLLGLGALIALLAWGAPRHAPVVPEVPQNPAFEGSKPAVDSPRLAALAAELKAGRRATLDEFWNDVRGKAPLVEPMAGDPRRCWVTFVWRGDAQTQRVGLAGGPPPLSGRTPLTRLAHSDLWYRTENVRNDARFVYWFHVNFPDERPTDPAGLDKLISQYPPRSDPLNPRQYQKRSLVELPEALPQPWIERLPGVARGKVSRHKIRSGILKQDRELTVYTPPDYDPQGPDCGLLVAFDGPPDEESTTLDNLIVRKRIAPVVAVFPTHVDRGGELSCSEQFADFLAAELVPWVRKNYRVSPDPGRTVVRGTSLGGLMASYCALRHPEVFGNVLSQSGSYQWFPGGVRGTAPPDAESGWLTRQFVTAPRSAVTFYLEAGTFEHFFPFSLLAENRRFRDVLEAKGYTVHYSEFSGNHDPINWRGSFADGLIALVGIGDRK